eukprot:jgi/Mesvir1/9615/Mv17241-RA.1
MRHDLDDVIRANLNHCLTETDLLDIPGIESRTVGKVRDTYVAGDKLVLVTTDRQSAFDRVLASIPFKGQVLNMTSKWWFDKAAAIVPHAVLSMPDPNVVIAKRCTVFPVEFVVRSYLTGSTSTSLWTHYKDGCRNYCGNELPDGMKKNQKLPRNILTPTTKEAVHDRPISMKEIVEEGLMSQKDLDITAKYAMELFEFGQKVAAWNGLILVDTKYEFGKDADGNILVIDEVHTPDSSRYWLRDTFEERIATGQEPENIDKEFLRLWFRDNCDPYNDKTLPDAPPELVMELSRRYIWLYEAITGERFVPAVANEEEPVAARLKTNVAASLATLVFD